MCIVLIIFLFYFHSTTNQTLFSERFSPSIYSKPPCLKSNWLWIPLLCILIKNYDCRRVKVEFSIKMVLKSKRNMQGSSKIS